MELRTGTFESTLDEKGRVGVPIRLRDLYEGKLIISIGLPPGKNAWIMTQAAFEKALERFEASGSKLTDAKHHAIKRLFKLSATEVEFDKSGRIAVPSPIRRYVGMTKECVVLSDDDHLEVWDAQQFFDYLDQSQSVVEEAMNEMGALRLLG